MKNLIILMSFVFLYSIKIFAMSEDVIESVTDVNAAVQMKSDCKYCAQTHKPVSKQELWKNLYENSIKNFKESKSKLTPEIMKSKTWQCIGISDSKYQTSSSHLESDYYYRSCKTTFTEVAGKMAVTFENYGGKIDYTYEFSNQNGEWKGRDDHWYRQDSNLTIRYDDSVKPVIYIEQAFTSVGPKKVQMFECI